MVMRVLINAVSIKEGGSLVVLENLLRHMGLQRQGWRWAVAAHPRVVLNLSPEFVVERVDIGNVDCWSGLLRWYEIGMRRAVREVSADLVFSITNYLPLRTLSCPTVLLEQHAGHFSPVFDQLHRQHVRSRLMVLAWDIKTRWVERSVRTATALTVQTASLADAISKRTGRARQEIRVIPHGPGLVSSGRGRKLGGGGPFRVGYITKWGVQKNLAVLVDAVGRLGREGRNIKLVLTLAPHGSGTAEIMAQAEQWGIDSFVENNGELDAAGVSALYDSLDLFVFPSLVESFGFPLVEAMAKGLPLLVADTPGNREVAGAGGYPFVPDDVAGIAASIARMMDDPEARATAAAASAVQGRTYSWDRAAAETLALLEDTLLLGTG